MPTEPIRYNLDPIGTNPDNLVANEPHTLEPHPVRVIAPTAGAYYGSSLVVFDSLTQTMLTLNTDYKLAELLQEPSSRYGQAVYALIAITNPNVSSEVSITYQCLGGYFQYDYSNLIDAYISAIGSGAPVDWLYILNKPYEYPPTLHQHLMVDLWGMEFVVSALERIRTAIMLSDVPAYEALIDYVNTRTAAWGSAGLTTINVGPARTFTTIQAAWDSLAGTYLTGDMLIKVDDGTYSGPGIVLKSHPQAHRIRIEGNVADPTLCVIDCTPSGDTTSLGFDFVGVRGTQLAGFKVLGKTSSSAPVNWTTACIRARQGSAIFCDENSIILSGGINGLVIEESSVFACSSLRCDSQYAYGIVADSNSVLHAFGYLETGLGKLTANNAPAIYSGNVNWIMQPVGALAAAGGVIFLDSTQITGCHTGLFTDRGGRIVCNALPTIDACNRGVYAGPQSHIWMASSTLYDSTQRRPLVTNCDRGFLAEGGGYIDAHGARAEGCGRGFMATLNGIILVGGDGGNPNSIYNGWAKNCTEYGYYAEYGGQILAWGTVSNSSGNAVAYNPAVSGTLSNANGVIYFN
jgi:hypothetical protein